MLLTPNLANSTVLFVLTSWFSWLRKYAKRDRSSLSAFS
ncbi:hypothetical protein IAD21_04284 [Abditibacteriota bacterium]|nr:hypothetical protein IAD21_04284 [Abditibacteriota bacterium]